MIELFVYLASFSVIPLVIYLIGYAAKSARISKFGIGIGKLLFIGQSWFYIYAICLELYEVIFHYEGVTSAPGDVMFGLMIATAVIYGLVIIGLVRRNKLTFFK